MPWPWLINGTLLQHPSMTTDTLPVDIPEGFLVAFHMALRMQNIWDLSIHYVQLVMNDSLHSFMLNPVHFLVKVVCEFGIDFILDLVNVLEIWLGVELRLELIDQRLILLLMLTPNRLYIAEILLNPLLQLLQPEFILLALSNYLIKLIDRQLMFTDKLLHAYELTLSHTLTIDNTILCLCIQFTCEVAIFDHLSQFLDFLFLLIL